MLHFPEPPKNYSSVFLDETDKPLPEKIDPRTRYAFFSTIAKGGKPLIKSCKDLHLSRFVCYKTLKPEFADLVHENPYRAPHNLREMYIKLVAKRINLA